MSSPIHVHVQDNTPLHVHVKKPKKGELSKQSSLHFKGGNDRHSVRPGPRARRKDLNGPWVPAPGKTSTRDKISKNFKWESDGSRLEVNQPQTNLRIHPSDSNPLRTSDLSTEEDNRLRQHLSEYEKKIENLMAEVGTLKNEAANLSSELSRSLKEKQKCLSCKKVQKEIKNYHSSCFAPLPDEDASSIRIQKALDRLVATAKSDKGKRKFQIQPSKDITLRVEQGNGDATVFVDSTRKKINKEIGLSEIESKVSFRDPIEDSYSDEYEQCCIEEIERHAYQDWLRTSPKEAELIKVEQELEVKEGQLDASHAALELKKKELDFMAKEYEETEKENLRLRKSVDKLNSSLHQSDDLVITKQDQLLRKLVEVEVNGVEAAKQVAALRDVINRLKYEKRLSHSDVSLVAKHRELLLQKFEEFESTNRDTRRLLQTEHKTLSDVQRLEEQRDILMRKMANTDSEILRLRSEVTQKRSEVEQLESQISEEKNHAHTLNELNKSVDATRAHLQRELRAREMENNRLHVQLKNIERDTDAIRREAEEATASARLERETMAREKDGLKKATRAQRGRAEKAEESLRVIESRLDDRERKLDEARSQADAWRDRYQRTNEEKAVLDDHVVSLTQKVADMESTLRTNEMLARGKGDDLKLRIEQLSSENSTYRSDAEKYKSEALVSEERARIAQKEVAELRSDTRQMEGVIAELKAQLRKAKSEAEEALLSAERVERNSRRMREDGSSEIERVREQMLDRMRDLQPLPELLKETEMKLQDAQDKLHVYEQRSAEQSRIIADMTTKTEDHSSETATLRQRIAALSDENRALEARLNIMHVKLDDRDTRVKETVLDTATKDEKIQILQLKMEEVTHERNSFKRQLESAIADTRKAITAENEKATIRDQGAQARIVDLETQITRLKTDVASVKRQKEDSDRRNQSKLQDVRDRLEQSESTNRSMRNYVNFLKTSYNNVFGGDASLTSTPVRARPGSSPHSPY